MKTVLITGANKGIGNALVKKFCAENFFVLGTYFKDMPSVHPNALFLELDLSSPESISHCVKKITALGKRVDILINNAGVLLDEDETKVIPEKLRQTLEVNLIGTVDFTERIIPLMQAGHIVNVSSSAGSLQLAGQVKSHFPYHYPAYKISKAALNMYTRTLATRLKSLGIIVSSVHPGWTRTDMGGPEADMSPEAAAAGIYQVAISEPETGQFWFKGESMPW